MDDNNEFNVMVAQWKCTLMTLGGVTGSAKNGLIFESDINRLNEID